MSDAREKALETDRHDWCVDHTMEPGIAGNAFGRGWDAAKADLPDRETVAGVISSAVGGGNPNVRAITDAADAVLALLRGEVS